MPVGGNCFCVADASQSCVHNAALLFTLAEVSRKMDVDVCGIFLITEFPFLDASPDGLMYVGVGESALVEVKCPYNSRCMQRHECMQRRWGLS